MPDGLLNIFGAAKVEVAPPRKSLSATLVLNAGPKAVRLLEDFFGDPGNSPASKKILSNIVVQFSKWCDGRPEPIRHFADATEADVAAYFDERTTPKTRKAQRVALRRLYRMLGEAELAAHNPVTLHRGGPQKNTNMPPLVVQTGAHAVEVVTEFLDKVAPGWGDPGSKGSNYLTVLHSLSRWAQAEGLSSLTQIDVVQTRAYLTSFERPKTQDQYASCLRRVFGVLVEKGILQANPFIYARDSQTFKDQFILYALLFARKTGPKFLDKTAGFFEKSTRTNSTMAVDHFAQWALMFGGVEKLTDITTNHLLLYREEGMEKFMPSTRGPYFACVKRYFDHLHAAGLLLENPASCFKQGASHPRAEKRFHINLDHMQSAMRERKGRDRRNYRQASIHDVIFFMQIDKLPYEQQYMFAAFVDYIARCRKYLSHDRLDRRVLPESHWPWREGKRALELGQSSWTKAEHLGAIVYINGRRQFSEAFIEAYNRPGSRLKVWAQAFLEDHKKRLPERMARIRIEAQRLEAA
ncbi:MAG TPA: hypothetical protein VHB73_06215 [Alphaproteobacteria bacterium]|nr:hypothetical protein [Alphaproteobacteria bacterium]